MYKISTGVRSVQNSDGRSILNIEKGQIFHTNAVGSFIVDSLAQGLSPLSIAQQIASRFDVVVDVALSDTREFIRTLELQGLIGNVPGDDDPTTAATTTK